MGLIMKTKIKVLMLVLSILMLGINLCSKTPVMAQNLELLSPYEAMVTIEANSGCVLYSYNEHTIF